jgi:hypothetical protein
MSQVSSGGRPIEEGGCVVHNLPLHPGTTGCIECLRNSQRAIPKKQTGRPQVGVVCRDGDRCKNLEQCRDVYTQDFLNADGSCPHFSGRED